MLSAFKNFFVTFLIAAIVFGAVGYFATRFLTDTITGIFDEESSEIEELLKPSDTSDPSSSAPNTSDTPDTGDLPSPEDIIEGKSFNMVFIVTDYQPDIYGDYLPSDELLEEMEEEEKSEDSDGNLTGILTTQYRRPRACSVLLFRADKEHKSFTVTSFPSIMRIDTAAGRCSMADLYNLYGRDYILSQISSMTGLTIDYYLLVNITELSDIVRQMDGFSMYLTKDVYFNGTTATTKKPSEADSASLPRLYSIGKNSIDGAGAMALMMLEDYSDGVSFRNTVTVNFFTEMLAALTAREEAQFTAFYDQICADSLVDTTFTAKDLISVIDLIYAFNREDFTVKNLEYPGRFTASTETEAAVFIPDIDRGIDTFKAYRNTPTIDSIP